MSGDDVDGVEAPGALPVVLVESRGERLVRKWRNSVAARDLAGLSTDQIMALLRENSEGPSWP